MSTATSIVWGGTSREITQPWGRTSLIEEPYWKAAQSHWHCGWDVDMPIGTPLYAARAGRVGYVGYGLLAICSATQTDWYVHIDRSVAAVGALVGRGQLAAYSGAKVPAGGYLTGPHLHFETQNSASALLGQAAPGYLNFPETSVDPGPILAGLFSTAQSALEAIDLWTDTDIAAVKAQILLILHTLNGMPDANGQTVHPTPWEALTARVLDLERKSTEAPTTAPTVDMSAVLAAIADLKAHPSYDPTDASMLAILTRLETAFREA
jgi:hypothetical protein